MSDTIAAVATPFGEGAIAVLRLSGDDALSILERATDRSSFGERRAERAAVRDERGGVIDDVLVTTFIGPRSYTGENVAEVSCHGGVLVTQRTLERLVECGARVAEAGEFTQRAFLNGKIDLTQAEAVMDVISAQSDLALRAAQHQLGGRIGEATEALRQEIIGAVAHVEAYIDFPEEDIDPDTGATLQKSLGAIETRIEELLSTSEQGRLLREGVRVVIYGEPNVGKSSLLNLLLGYDRALVSEVAGTTRDSVEEVVNLGGLPVRLIDTAGLRESEDAVEEMGIARTRDLLSGADLVIEVVDGSSTRSEIVASGEVDSVPSILVRNKSDLPTHPSWHGVDAIELSCLNGTGVDTLIETMQDRLAFGAQSWGQEAVAVNARHQSCLRRALEGIQVGRKQLGEGASPEFAAVDLRLALDAIGEVAGKVDVEDLLGEIFGRFCIGK